MKRKHEKESEALKRKDEMLKKKAEEQRDKRDERMRRVQEARKAQELKNQAKNSNKVNFFFNSLYINLDFYKKKV